MHIRTKAAPTALSGDAAEGENRPVVAVSRSFFVVAVGDGAGVIHKTRSQDGADNFHFACALCADAVGESQGKRERRGVRGR